MKKTTEKKKPKLYWVYVIQSLEPRFHKRTGAKLPGFFYVGLTTDPARRLKEHNGYYKNKGGKYTALHRPWKAMALWGPYVGRSDATKAERALKKGKRGSGRLKWATKDSPWCRGEGINHPWVKNPETWKPEI